MTAQHRVVGVDESGKGDFFGPLVVAAFYADDADTGCLLELGVRDGKRLSNNRILEIDEILRVRFPHHVLVKSPEAYNKQYDKVRNLNKFLAGLHAAAIKQLLADETADLIIIDQFGKPELIEDALKRDHITTPVQQRFRGEEVIQVAAASILARASFLREIDRLSAEYHMTLPRGAAPQVDEAGREIVRSFGSEVLLKVAKVHFKNYQRIINPVLF